MHLLAIDPGATSGWALFKGDRLLACGITSDVGVIRAVQAPHLDGAGPVDRVVIERPVIYPGGRTRNPNDVLKVAVNAGEWGGWSRTWGVDPEYVEPAEWKGGSVPKDIQNNRDRAKLSAAETSIVAKVKKGLAKSKHEHFLDAIGIGLQAVGR